MNFLLVLAPILTLAVGGIVLMMLDAFQKEDGQLAMPTALLHFVAAAAALALWQRGIPAEGAALVAPWLTIDRTGLFLAAVISVGGALASLLAGGYLAEHKMDRGEYYPLLAFASAGAIMLAQSGDTLTLFLGLETMSLGVYALTGFRRSNARSIEAALKYFLLGSFAAAMLLFGVALLYAITGHTDYVGIAQSLRHSAELPNDLVARAAEEQVRLVGTRISILSLIHI